MFDKVLNASLKELSSLRELVTSRVIFAGNK